MANSTAAPTGPATEILKEIQPTVFIGLGGTGKEILLRLRRRILLYRWKDVRISNLADFPIAQFIYFDLDTQEAAESERGSADDLLRNVVKFQSGEKIQDKLDLRSYFDNQSAYPLIKEWFPSTQQLEKFDPSHGAGQIRALARLQFFQKSIEFRTILQNKAREAIASLDDERHLQSLGVEIDRSGYRVVVVSSSAGGTGSGSFLDAGFLARALDDPEPQSVSLILMLGSAFLDANASRVQANTFAALKELEFCMNRNHRPRYVERWQESDPFVPDDLTPYDDVYLIDNANLGNERTNVREHIYDMLADILFEDFGNSDFAKRKRSIAPNTQIHKAPRYFPPLPASLPNVLSYSQGYSSFGQAIIETKARHDFERRNYETVRDLVNDFYNLESEAQQVTAREDHLGNFLEQRLHLSGEGYQFLQDPRLHKFFHKAPENMQPMARIYRLVNELLAREDGVSLTKGVLDRVAGGLEDIRHNADFAQWPARIVELQRELDREINGLPGDKGKSPRAREVDAQARRIWEGWTSNRDGGVEDEMYTLVEDYRTGGILYALDLMKRIKDRLGNKTTGFIHNLTDAKAQFQQWAEQMLGALHSVPLENLPQLRGRHAEERGKDILREGVKPLLENYVQFQLYALACDAAMQRLTDFSENFLGHQNEFDENENQKPSWTGLIGRLDEGRRRLLALVDEVGREIQILDSDRATPMRWTLDNGYLLQEPPSAEELRLLAKQVIEEIFNGTRMLFSRLGTPEGLVETMNALRQLLHERLYLDEEAQLPTVIEVLVAQGGTARKELKKLMDRALPWIDADTGRMAGFAAQRFKMILAVADKQAFDQAFSSYLKASAPRGIMPAIEESGERDRLVCYCELSGIPLNILVPLKTSWATSYRMERDKMPLHNHSDSVRFPSPIVPNEADIKHRGELVAIYLKGVAFGLLLRGSIPDKDEAAERRNHYFYEKATGAWSSIGVEQAILTGEREELRGRIRERIGGLDDDFEAEQYLGLAALFLYYAEAVYPPHVVKDPVRGDRETINFQHAVAGKLANEYLERYRRQVSLSESEAKHQRDTLRNRIAEWTIEIPESKGDLRKDEVDYVLARPKRSIDERFSPQDLRRILEGESAVDASANDNAPPPLPSSGASYTVANKGTSEKSGPFTSDDLIGMVARGELNRNDLVWKHGSSDWKRAAEMDELSSLFATPSDSPPPLPSEQ